MTEKEKEYLEWLEVELTAARAAHKHFRELEWSESAEIHRGHIEAIHRCISKFKEMNK